MSESTSQARIELENIRFNGEYLEFRHQKDFDTLVKFLETKTESDLDSWEKTLPSNFVSLRKLYKNAQEAELKNLSSLKRKSTTELTTLKSQNNLRSNFVKSNLNSFIFEDDNTFRMNIFKREFGVLANKDGLVSISGHLLQFTDEYVKVLVGGNKHKIGQLKESKADKPAEGIYVRPATKVQKTTANGRTEFSSQESYKGYNPDNRIRWGVTLRRYTMPVYDYNDIQYQNCLYDAAYNGTPESNCQPPIIAWNHNNSDYYVEAWHEYNQLWWWIIDRAPVPIKMNVTCNINGQQRSFSFGGPYGELTGYAYMNLNQSNFPYVGSGGAIDVTNANHVFEWLVNVRPIGGFGYHEWIEKSVPFQ